MPPLSTPTGFAHRMLSKMGWKEGDGLGKSKQGVKSFVKVTKREDGMGLGMEKDVKKNEWHFGVFEEAILSVQHLDTRKKKRKRREQQVVTKVKEDHMLYQEMFSKTGGARLGMRARATQKGKLERTEGNSEARVVETSLFVEMKCQKESNSSETITEDKFGAAESLLMLGDNTRGNKEELKKEKRKKEKRKMKNPRKT